MKPREPQGVTLDHRHITVHTFRFIALHLFATGVVALTVALLVWVVAQIGGIATTLFVLVAMFPVTAAVYIKVAAYEADQSPNCPICGGS